MRPARTSPLPGFRLTLGYTLFYLGVLVLAPLALLVAKSAAGGWAGFAHTVLAPRALASLRFTLLTALAAASINVVFGLVLIMTKLDQYDYAGAATLGVVMLAISLLLLLVIHSSRTSSERRRALA
jgi:sulfate transport system permease protein